MATMWADIVSAAMVEIDDVRLEEQMAVSPAQFYRRMSALIEIALPLMSRPPELLDYLMGEMEEPEFDDYEWTSTAASTQAATPVATGMTGYDLCSVTQRVQAANGTISLVPYAGATYDAETGVVTMPQQTSEGINYDFDFYTDGEFAVLSKSQMRLYALAVAVVWDERFSRTWLNMQAKIHDDSFSTVNEANYTEKITRRLHDNRIAFNDELRAYEQLCAYNGVFKHTYNKTELM